MTDEKQDRERLAGALRLLAESLEEQRAWEGITLPRSRSLGSVLSQIQQEQNLNSKRMAFAMGVPFEDLQRWKADLDVPSEECLFRLCEALGTTPHEVLPMVEETARLAMHRLIDEAGGIRHVMAARERGPAKDEGDRILGQRLPVAIRRVMAAELDAGAEDYERMAEELRRLGRLDREERDVAVAGLVSLMLLEGEEDPGYGEFS